MPPNHHGTPPASDMPTNFQLVSNGAHLVGFDSGRFSWSPILHEMLCHCLSSTFFIFSSNFQRMQTHQMCPIWDQLKICGHVWSRRCTVMVGRHLLFDSWSRGFEQRSKKLILRPARSYFKVWEKTSGKQLTEVPWWPFLKNYHVSIPHFSNCNTKTSSKKICVAPIVKFQLFTIFNWHML